MGALRNMLAQVARLWHAVTGTLTGERRGRAERRRTNRRVRPAGLPGVRQSAVVTGGVR